MLNMRRCLRSFANETLGLSAIEFAFVSPIFMLLLVVGSDALRLILATDEIESISSSVAELISEHQTASMNYVDLQFYKDSAMLTYPQLLVDSSKNGKAWGSTISISMASVDFGAAQSTCGSSCVYVPKMVWSGGTNPRSCLVPMVASSDNAQPSPTTLPAHVYGPGSSIVVDVVYTFKPFFQNQFFSGITIRRSYYIAPRFQSLIKYQTISGDNGIAKSCSGYS